MRIGYFIPQFPGQTHSMFWRERNALKKFGVETVLISTRKPSENLETHTWSKEASQKTFYLFPLKISYLFHGICLSLKNLSKIYSLMGAADVPSLKDKLKYAASFILGCELGSFALQEHLEHIHIHSSAESLNVALFAKAISGITYSITLHNPLVIFGANQKQKWAHSDFGIIVTNDLLSQVKRDLKDSLPKKLYSATMGVDLDKFKIRKRQRNQITRIFSCGRIHRCKGYDVLLQSIANIDDPFILRIAGGLDSSDPEHLNYLMSLLSELNLHRKAEFLGPLSEDMIIDELARADLFALTSRVETIGVVFMEAMAMGLPVVATDVGGVKELVVHGENGFLVESENIDQITQSVQQLIRDPALRSKMGREGREKIISSFSSDNSALKIIEGLNVHSDYTRSSNCQIIQKSSN